MAAGGDKKNLSKSEEFTPEIEFDDEGAEEEIANLNSVLERLEQCVDNLDQQASTLTDRIKEFLEESKTQGEGEASSMS